MTGADDGSLVSGVDERVETVRAGFRSFGHPIKEEWPYEGAVEMVMVDGCASPETCDMCAAEAALSVLAADLQAAEQRAEEAGRWPIETLDESALRTIQAQAARVTALETVVAGLEQRADDAEKALRGYRRDHDAQANSYDWRLGCWCSLCERAVSVLASSGLAAAVVSAEPTEETA